MCVYTHVSLWLWKPDITVMCLPQSLSTLIFQQGLTLILEIQLDWPSSRWDPPVSTCVVPGFCKIVPGFYVA